MRSTVDKDARRRLLLAREAARFTLRDAAAAIRVSRHTLMRWEDGRGSPSIEELKALCMLYGVTPGYMLFGADVMADLRQALSAASAKGVVSP